MRIAIALTACLIGALAQAQPEAIESFDDPVLNDRYRELIHSFRCMKCQNQSIAESTIDQAADIRALVHERVAEGQSDREIRAYLVSRYGDFISYTPPFRPSTWLLWAAPALFIAAGAFAFARVLRTRMQQPLDEDLQ